jgi:hypothetical protein
MFQGLLCSFYRILLFLLFLLSIIIVFTFLSPRVAHQHTNHNPARRKVGKNHEKIPCGCGTMSSFSSTSLFFLSQLPTQFLFVLVLMPPKPTKPTKPTAAPEYSTPTRKRSREDSTDEGSCLQFYTSHDSLLYHQIRRNCPPQFHYLQLRHPHHLGLHLLLLLLLLPQGRNSLHFRQCKQQLLLQHLQPLQLNW